MWLIGNCKNGISSYEIAKELGFTQNKLFFLINIIRLAMHDTEPGMFSGQVEADETYIGGLARNMHKSRKEKVIKGTGGSGKTVVMGLLERHTDPKSKQKVIDTLDYDPKKSTKASRVKVAVVPDVTRKTLQGQIREQVEPGATMYTDELASYAGLSPEYVHNVINHAESYVQGHVHTNGMENFWALLKRMIKGSYVSVEPFHLFRYLDEETFRFNERKLTDSQRFSKVAASIADKRLTYVQLTGKEEPSVA
jgi:transposase-like protein